MKIITSSIPLALVSCTLLATATACSSGGGREYSVPSSICNIPVNQKATTALLPDGKKLEERGGSLEDSPSFCKLLVDKSLTISITTYQADEYYDPMDPKEAHRFSNRAKMKDIPAEWEGAIGDNYSTITTKCTGPSAKYVVTEISAKAGDDDTSQRRKDIQDFATEFTSGVKKKIGCTQ